MDCQKSSEKLFSELPKAIVLTPNNSRIQSLDTFVHTFRKKHLEEPTLWTKTVDTFIDKRGLSVKNIE